MSIVNQIATIITVQFDTDKPFNRSIEEPSKNDDDDDDDDDGWCFTGHFG